MDARLQTRKMAPWARIVSSFDATAQSGSPGIAFAHGLRRAGCFVTGVESGRPAKPEIDRDEHQSSTMRNRDGKGPESQLRWRYPRERARMTPVEKPKDTETDDEKGRCSLDLALPLSERKQERERQQHQQSCQEMAGRQRPECSEQGPRTFLHQPGRNRERPSHPRIDTMVQTARDNREPKPRRRPICHQLPTDG